MGRTYKVRHDEFPPLTAEDLVRYKDVSTALRNFEIAAIYNFMGKSPEERQEFVCALNEHLAQCYELFMVNGVMNCGPLCPRGRSCVMCAWSIESEEEEPTEYK